MTDTIRHHPETGEKLSEATPAATVIVFRDDPAGGAPLLCMVERSAKMAFAPDAAVFPGGRVDPDDYAMAETLAPELERDEGAARIAAIRETIEETGLGIGLGETPPESELGLARKALDSGTAFSELVARFGWRLDLAAFTPWARWRPPGSIETRIFDTRFYIADAGATELAGKADLTENDSLFWANAQTVLDRADAGEVKIIFPTRRNLERLAQFADFASARAHADTIPVRTVLTYIEQREGGKFICLPDGHGYPVIEEPLGRALRG